MKPNRYLWLFLIIILFGLKSGNTPSKPAPAWNVKFNSDIQWQQVTPLGNLVVSTSEGLHGINGETGENVWNISWLNNLSPDSYQPLPGTFFSEITLPDAIIILNPYDGAIIGNTKESGFKNVLTKNLLYESGTLLIFGFKDDLQGYLSVFDVNSGQELWSSNEIFGKPKSGLGGLMNALQVASSLDEGADNQGFDVIEVSQDNFIVATATGIFSVATRSGDLQWSAELPTPKGAVSTTSSSKLIKNTSAGQFYYAKSNYLMAYSIKDGKQIWKGVTKINGLVNEVVQYKEGLILLPETDPNNNMFGTRLSYIDATTGEKRWGKKNDGIKLPGSVLNHQWVEGELVLSMQSGEKSFLNILNPQTGTFKFQDALKIKGVLDYTEMTPSGLLYFTSANQYGKGEVNLFDLNTGQPRFDKSITARFKEGSPTQSLLRNFKGNLVYVYADDDNALYEIDLESGMLRLLRDGLKIEGKESITNIEVRTQGIMLNAPQNVLMLDFNGKLLFQKYYPAPTEPGILKALYAMESIRAALYSAQSHMVAASFDQIAQETESGSGRDLLNGISDAYEQQGRDLQAYSSAAMNKARQRFNATRQGSDHIYMMIALDKQKTGVARAIEGKKFALVRVSKDTGEITDIVDMHDEKEPSYQVDNISNSIYYRNESHQVTGYRF